MTDDKKISDEFVQRDINRLREAFKGAQVDAIGPENIDIVARDTDAKRFTHFIIGIRGELSRNRARHVAKLWRKTLEKFPNSLICISLAGYDEDPREIWDIAEAACYVRQWARFAGMDDMATAIRVFERLPEEYMSGAISFLAACGVFGEEAKRMALRAHRPIPMQ
jgi:hypothetical protein